ncbi:uncharacterized protein LOC143917936 [Arctopsyche grandis]|uniref:uncharacterized protein LOC143917936 n=1 Tax=Arctopsyche grandis TaxID=121162 RepID=UPI00406D6A4F
MSGVSGPISDSISGSSVIISDDVTPCRLCLSQNSTTIDASEGRLRSLLHLFFAFWINSDDKSKVICMECLDTVMAFYEFYKKVRLAQKEISNTDVDDILSDDGEDPDFIKDKMSNNVVQPYEFPICKIEECNLYDGCSNSVSIKEEPVEFYDEDAKNTPFPLESITPKEECESSDDFLDSPNHDSGHYNSQNLIRSKKKLRYQKYLNVNRTSNSNLSESKNTDYNFPSEIYRNGKLFLKGPSLENAINKFYDLGCEVCKEKVEFAEINDLFKHYELEHKTKGYVICCNSKLYNRRAICMHMGRHLQPTAFECPICKKIVSRPIILEKHIQSHLPDEEKPYKCQQCDKRFGNMAALNNHKQIHIPISERDSYTCKVCGKVFTMSSSLRNHVALVHGNVKYLCSECGQSCQSKTNLTLHMLTHEPAEKHQARCSQCDVVCKNKYLLRRHMKRHADLLQCSLCEFSTPLQIELRAHMRVKHSDSKPYSCVICGKQFKMKSCMNTHMAQHTGERKYLCPFCPKTFAASGNYYTHRKRMHSEEIKNQNKSNKLDSDTAS